MSPLIRIRTILSATWQTASSEPSFLVPGIALSLITLFESSYFSKIVTDISLDMLSPDIRYSSLFFLATFILATSALKTIVGSQLYLSVAANTLRRPTLLTRTSRIKGAIRYITIEIVASLILIISLIPFAITSLLDQSSPMTPLLAFSGLCFFGIILIIVSLIKYLFLGYALLSPLKLRSALALSAKLFVRYQRFSVLFFFVASILLSLFTFLQNLVMLQGAFLYKQTEAIIVEIASYTALLLLGTFIAIFFSVLWVQYFLLLTNKRQEEKTTPIIIPEEVPETPPVL